MHGKKLAAVIAVALGAIGGTAWASGAVGSIVGADGAINGCYKQQSGQLRVVAAGEACGPSELQLQWAQSGAKGEPGPQGLAGPQGAPGKDGANGAPGAAGRDGVDGRDGTNGADGAPGAPGRDGVDGQDGTDGADGISVTSEPLGSGDVFCPTGGSKFYAANGVSYACNGMNGTGGGGGPTYQTVNTAHNGGSPDSTEVKSVVAMCSSGAKVVAGGYNISTSPSPLENFQKLIVTDNSPAPDGAGGLLEGWRVRAQETTTYDGVWFLQAWAICAIP